MGFFFVLAFVQNGDHIDFSAYANLFECDGVEICEDARVRSGKTGDGPFYNRRAYDFKCSCMVWTLGPVHYVPVKTCWCDMT